MERQALRGLILFLIVVALMPCAASDVDGSKIQPDFIVTIGEKGVEENIEQVFSLGPSATLRVVDESNKAILLPERSAATEGTAAGYTVAYAFENGRCNFGKQVAYKDAFLGYAQPVWVHALPDAGAEGKPVAVVSNYTFTNPPVEYLSGGVSFCVRFTTSLSATSTTTTTSPTTQSVISTEAAEPTPNTDVEDSTTHTDSDAPSSGSSGEPGSQPSTDETQDGSGGSQSPSGTPQQESEPKIGEGKENEDGELPKEPGRVEANEVDPRAPQSATGSSVPTVPMVDLRSQHGATHHAVDADGHGRLRRLSGADDSEVKYLTIVVHSAACGSAAGTFMVSAVVSTITATLLSTYYF
ncbi:Toxoplasma gondii family A protein [Toxoplasma gondii GAB2-2007-GAL-DOM2]|uniref:Toxoplasma gondii family A protein n=5 Tax=Toxoplasma gondii TaxID=5811 RepID=S7W7B3_TOXGG|nr:Toxoplasma gondii family A protein [Toxoplasma gondii GT1]KAF4643254.1 Toxoplasma gondii family A protein [Toxoplasma gondii]KFG32999.1 Toxoplasma gondii family A protein [Toxoplasma gondii GAB2-2007-GAL-DOM2]KFG51328.1 Toxoplasma gondii family A protein [Toxoplasma gondii FOU]RQX69090.1 Toxoplasma gondii family A protein [Toxoplasma gondii CAST]